MTSRITSWYSPVMQPVFAAVGDVDDEAVFCQAVSQVRRGFRLILEHQNPHGSFHSTAERTTMQSLATLSRMTPGRGPLTISDWRRAEVVVLRYRPSVDGVLRVNATIMPPRTGTGVTANCDRPWRPTTVHPLEMPTAAPNKTSLTK